MRPGLIILLLCSNCGFLGEEPFPGQRVPDVAPWQDTGPLTICDGSLRLGAPASTPAGFCGDAPAHDCKSDGDCGSRERCNCGKCTLGYCDLSADCQAGFICTVSTHRCDRPCMKDGDCKKGESCVEGRNLCRGSCGSDGDCQAGEQCNLTTGECGSAFCAGDSDCMSGHSCALQRRPETLAEPAPVVEDDGSVSLWLEQGGASIIRATSQDGLAFHLDPSAPPLDGRAPSVIKRAQGYLMLLARGADLFRATSLDGISWSVDATPAIPGADQPSLVQFPDHLAAYVTVGGRVARSLSSDLDGASFSPPEEVLAPTQLVDPTLWRNVDSIASPFAQALVDANGKPFVRLWFSARGQESAPAFNFGVAQEVPANFSVGEAASSDGASFTPYPFNPVFDRVVNFLDHPSELDPAVVSVGGQQLLYYRRASADTTTPDVLGVARSPLQPR